MPRRRLPRPGPVGRLLTLLTGAVLGLVGMVAFAGPADARHHAISGEAVCDAQAHEWVVTWTVTANGGRGQAHAYKLVGADTEPAGSTLVEPAIGAVLPTGETFQVTQRLPGDTDFATLLVRRMWFFYRQGGWHTRVEPEPVRATVTFDRPCAPAAPVQVDSVSSCAGLVVTVSNPADGQEVTARLRPNVGDEQQIPLRPGEGQTVSFPESEDLEVTVVAGEVTRTLTWQPPECAPPEPGEVTVDSHSTCEELTIELSNPRDGIDTVVTVIPSVGGSQEVPLPAGDSAIVTVPGAEGLSADVVVADRTWVFAWVPGDCTAEVPIGFASDCDSLTVEITNPQVAGPLEAIVATDAEHRAATLTPLETTELVVPAGPGTVATVTAGQERVEAEWQPPADCPAATAADGFSLPRTGFTIAGAVFVALAAIALGFGLYLGPGRRAGLRRHPRHRRAA